MTSKKTTAVEWLCEQIEQYTVNYGKPPRHYFKVLKKRAKDMQKEQMKSTWLDSAARFANDAKIQDKSDFESYFEQNYSNTQNNE